MKKLLVGYDGSEPARAAAHLAGRLARPLGASVTVLTSGHAATTVGKRLVPTDDATLFLPTAEEGVDIVRQYGVVADARSESGDPAPTLISAAHRGDYDLMLGVTAGSAVSGPCSSVVPPSGLPLKHLAPC